MKIKYLELVCLKGREEKYITSFCMMNKSEIEYKKELFSDKEKEHYNSIGNKKRREDYFCGRFCAKKAVFEILYKSNTDTPKEFKEISILNGVFNQPVIVTSKTGNIKVSISHSKNMVIAIAFSEMILAGVDVEMINEKRISTIVNQFTDKEKKILEQSYLKICGKKKLCMVFWTVKEAISKAVHMGLTVPLFFFEINKIEIKRKYWISTFTYLPGFKAISCEINGNMVSVVFPEEFIEHIEMILKKRIY